MGKYENLLEEIEEITYTDNLKDYHAFVYWFIEVSFGLEKEKIINSICDGTHDKGVDAVIIDDIERKVTVIQSKFEQKGNKVQIPESEIKLFTTVTSYFESKKALQAAMLRANQVASKLLERAFDAIKQKQYSLELIFITTHKKAPNLDKMIQETYQFRKGEFVIYDYEQVMLLYEDKLRDFTPRLGKYPLPYKDNDKALIRTAKFKSWVLSVPLEEIQGMVRKYDDKLFMKNVRNFLGDNRCNKGIQETLKADPEKFWYFNNGITILCDDANIVIEEKYIHIVNPQIVNGCQTARSIEKFRGDLHGDVLVRVVASSDHAFADYMILYQNSSNPVKKRDLKSNDPVQVRLRREFKLKNWYYEVKRGESHRDMSKKSPAIKHHKYRVLNNEEVAKVLAAIKLGPNVAVSKGSEVFFDDYYADLFSSKLSTFNCLAPALLFWMIRDTYKGAGQFHEFKSHVFKNPASFYVLNFICQSLDNRNDIFEKKIIAFCENKDSDYQKFVNRFGKIIDEYFKIIYKAYKASEEPDHNTFFQSSTTLNDIEKKYSKEIKSAHKKVESLFKEVGLI